MLHCSCNAGDTKKLMASAEGFSARVNCIHFQSSCKRWSVAWWSIPLHLHPDRSLQGATYTASTYQSRRAQPILSPDPLQQGLAGFDSLVVLPKPGVTRVFRCVQMTALKTPGPCCVWWRRRWCTPLLLAECLVLVQGQCFPRNGHEDWLLQPSAKWLCLQTTVLLQHYFFLRSSIFWDPVSGLGFMRLRTHPPPTPFFHYLNPRSLCY